mgnify:CR=1 FL=1
MNYLDRSIENSLSMFLKLKAKESSKSRDDCQTYGMQGVVKESIVNLLNMPNKDKIGADLLFKDNWK